MASSPSKATIEAPLTITALLNSLHTHLQTQTQLLPTLHAQLGLPQSALTDELSALRERLAACVEQQIELRREEVNCWMKKCDDVERDCTRYTKALGGHVKALGASIGELRKQQVLPVRYEMLNQYQDKLDQLYKTRVEQLTNLTNRVTTLSRTLGTDFFVLEIMELAAAQGESLLDVMSLRDVTPERFSKLEKELVRGKGEITRRLQQLAATFMQMDWLYHELGVSPPSCEDPISISPSSSSLAPPLAQRSLSVSVGSSDPFLSSISSVSTPTPLPRGRSSTSLLTNADHISDYHKIFALFVLRADEAEAEGKAIEPGSLIGVEGVEPTVGLMHWAEQAKTELDDIKKRRETHIQAMFDQLETLWKRLGVEDQDIDEFVENNRGSTEENVQAYESELERMLELKRERMSLFISNARAEIEALWNDLMVGEDERVDFAPFVDDEHTEELLMIHENEIKLLKNERRRKAPLLASIRKYFEICDEEKELAAAAMDQNRLTGRGARDPGRLLREEKMRKRVSREKPRLEQDLLISIPVWEEEHNKPFLVNGINIIDVLVEAVGAADKENARKKPRAGSVPPRATTPSYSGPSASRSTTGPNSITRPGSSMSNSHSIPNKRQKLGSSTASTTSKGGRAQNEALPHRAPFGNRSGINNMTSPDADAHMTTAHKPGRTPSSSLPRPVSVPKMQPSHGSRSGCGAGIGLGYASTMQQMRSTSSSTTASRSYALLGAASHVQGDRLHPKPNARNSRRESFRPRPSVDGGPHWSAVDSGGSRYGGFSTSAVKEEDEY